MKQLVTRLSVALGLSLFPSPAGASPTWIYAAQPPVRLSGTTITPFDDGSALLVGANEKNGDAQEYSATTNTWSIVGRPMFPRTRHVAVRLPDGRVLLCGGVEFRTNDNGLTFRSEAEIYDHTARAFARAGEMSAPRVEPGAAASCDDRAEPLVLVTGGWNQAQMDSGGHHILDSAEIYRVSTGRWDPAPPMGTKRLGHTATCIPGRGVLVVGGQPEHGVKVASSSAELFDPVTETWKAVASMHAERTLHTATLLSDGTVLVAGGAGRDVSGAITNLNSAELYDPTTDVWTKLPAMSEGRRSPSQTMLPNDRVLIAGGQPVNDVGGSTSSIDLYEPVSGAARGSRAFRRVEFPAMILKRTQFPMALLRGDTLFVASNDARSSGAEILRLSRKGERCEHAFECQTGYCVDGVCCESACDEACSVCSRATHSSTDGDCESLSCRTHLTCWRPTNEAPTCFGECQSAEQCEVGYACDPTSHTCVEPQSTFVSQGCSVAASGAPSSGRWAWLGRVFLALLALGAGRAERSNRRPRRSWALLAFLTAGCDGAAEESLCAPFVQCGESCVNSRTDRQNCGGCGIACKTDELCLDGVCTLECAGGTRRCEDRCVDLSLDPANCGACGETCEVGQICAEGACVLPGGRRSYIFPGVTALGGAHATEPRFILMADGPATIFYTTDGSSPKSPRSRAISGRSPLVVPPRLPEAASQRQIQWYAVYDLLGPEPDVHTYLSVVDPALMPNFGAQVETPELSPDGAPLVVVAPGELVRGTVRHRAWTSDRSGYCPTCIVALRFGLQSTQAKLGCDLYFLESYPGREGTFGFEANTPREPGRYALAAWLLLDTSCRQEHAPTPDAEQVGLLIVR